MYSANKRLQNKQRIAISPQQPVHLQSKFSLIAFTFDPNPNPFSIHLDQVDSNPVQIQSACVHTGVLAIQIQSKSNPSLLGVLCQTLDPCVANGDCQGKLFHIKRVQCVFVILFQRNSKGVALLIRTAEMLAR